MQILKRVILIYPIAIKPPEERNFREESVGDPPLKLKWVEVMVECRGEVVGVIVGKQLKMGTEKLCATQYKTPLHVADPEFFCDCLDWKYKNTCDIWKEIDDK